VDEMVQRYQIWRLHGEIRGNPLAESVEEYGTKGFLGIPSPPLGSMPEMNGDVNDNDDDEIVMA
jgi:hypothetical protein